jgi:pterin-4a-carbinolamine dehydratase
MDQAAIDNSLRTLAGWRQLNDRIVKSFSFDDFRSAMKFVGRVADAAVAVTDEVTLEVRSNLVTLAVYTPDADTITETGLALAARIDRLTGDHRHRVGMVGP